MYVNIVLGGRLEEIVKRAVKAGYVKSATEAVRMGLIELGEKLDLADDSRFDAADLARAKKIMARVRSGKEKLVSEAEFYKNIGAGP